MIFVELVSLATVIFIIIAVGIVQGLLVKGRFFAFCLQLSPMSSFKCPSPFEHLLEVDEFGCVEDCAGVRRLAVPTYTQYIDADVSYVAKFWLLNAIPGKQNDTIMKTIHNIVN